MTKKVIRWVVHKIMMCCCVCAIILAVSFVLLRQFSPYFVARRHFFENWVTRELHQKVSLANIDMRWRWLSPILILKDVTLYDENTKPLLQAEQLSLSFNLLRCLLSFTPEPNKIYLSGLTLYITRDSTGRLVINDHVLKQQKHHGETIHEPLMWIFQRPDIFAQKINIHYRDRHGNVLPITNLAFQLDNEGDEHHVMGHLSLAQTVQTKGAFHLDIKGDPVSSRKFEADLYLQFANAVLDQWLSGYKLRGVKFHSGTLNGKLWAQWHAGNWQKSQMLFEMTHSAVSLPNSQHSKLFVNHWSGNLLWHRRDDNSWQLLMDQINCRINGKQWDLTNGSVDFTRATEKKSGRVKIQFDQLDLNNIVSYFDDPLITQLSPHGILRNTRVDFEPGNLLPQAFISDVFFWRNNAALKIPAISGLSGHFLYTGDSAKIVLLCKDLQIKDKRHFPRPLAFDYASGLFTWQKTPRGQFVQGDEISLVTRHGSGSLSGALLVPDDFSKTRLSLLGEVHVKDLYDVQYYYPNMPGSPNLRAWLVGAVGHSDPFTAEFSLRGPVSHFPFADHTGVIEFYTHFRDANLVFDKAWPAVSHLSTVMSFINNKMYFKDTSGVIATVPFKGIAATLLELEKGKEGAMLVEGKVLSAFSKAQYFVNHSPLRETLGRELRDMQIKGKMALTLQMLMPINDPKVAPRIQGNVKMPSGKIILPAWQIVVDRIFGTVNFTEKSLSATQLTGRLFDNPMTMDIATKHLRQHTFTEVRYHGQLEIPIIEKYFHTHLSHIFSGKTSYFGKILLSTADSPLADELFLKSDLQGIQIKLPPPFAKQPAQKIAASVEALLDEKQVPITIHIGKMLQAKLQLILQNSILGLDKARIHLGAGKVQAPKQKGVFIEGKLNEFNVSVWKRALQSMPQMAHYGDSLDLLNGFNVFINHLIFGKTRFRDIRVAGSYQNGWHFSAKNKRLSGRITLPQRSGGIVNADFDYLTWPKLSSATRERFRFQDVPGINFSCGACRYGRFNLGRVKLVARKSGHQLNINKLSVTRRSWALSGMGTWQASRAGQLTTIKGAIQSYAVGETLKDFGFTKSILARNGQMDFSLSWPAPPYEFSPRRLNGKVNITLEDGSVVSLGKQAQAQMQTGKMLTFLSLSAIRRRLAIDFKEVTDKGFEFNVMKAHLNIKNGEAYTKKTFLDGPVAFVGLRGRIGLRRQDFDVQVDVIPYVTSSLPIVATIAAGPVAGVVTWVADKMVSPAVGILTSNVYHMTGSWNNPQMQLIKRTQHAGNQNSVLRRRWQR